MPAYYNKVNKTWTARFYLKDAAGRPSQHTKRGFTTKREALQYENAIKLKSENSLNMPFSAFVDLYRSDMSVRIREHTWVTKNNIIEFKILPYFGDMPVNDIEARDIVRWQNSLMAYKDKNGNRYSPTYLKTIHNQLSAIFNHAVRYYGLSSNPASKVGAIGKGRAGEMQFWTKEEYERFSEAIMDKPLSYYAFEVLYWCGLRVGELLALTRADFNLESKTLSITKSYQRIEKRDVITPPKTEKSVRTVVMPNFLCEEMREFFDSLYGLENTDRVFQITKSYLHNEIRRGCKASGIKTIRVHDLRHQYVKYTTKKFSDFFEKFCRVSVSNPYIPHLQ